MRHGYLLATGMMVVLLLVLLGGEREARASGLDGPAEVAVGGGVLVLGYGLGAAPALTGPGNQTAAIPVIGPLVWWMVTLQRIDRRVAYERAHPCQSDGEDYGCFLADTSGIDQFFHITMALPYAIGTSAAQAAGLALIVHGASRLDSGSDHAAPKPRSTGMSLALEPTGNGLRVFGTF